MTCGALLGHLGDVENSAATSVGHQQQLLSVLQCDRTEMLSLYFLHLLFVFLQWPVAAIHGSRRWAAALSEKTLLRKEGPQHTLNLVLSRFIRFLKGFHRAFNSAKVILILPGCSHQQLLRVIRVKF